MPRSSAIVLAYLDGLDGKPELVLCPGCEVHFVPQSKNQRFCDGAEGKCRGRHYDRTQRTRPKKGKRSAPNANEPE